VQANAYYTPRGSQGFAVHHDTHDVLILQVAGEKRWLLYEPLVELPLKTQRYSKALGEPGEPTDDFVLRAGDTLYLPRGWLHQAETSDTDSLHLTVGINAYTWLDAAKAALAEAEGEAGFRHGVEPGSDEADRLAERLGAELDPGLVAMRRRRRFVQTRRPIRADGLGQLRALKRLDAETLLERRDTVIADLEEGPDGLALLFEGKELSFPAHCGPELAACYEADEPFRLSELPGDLDAEGRLVLARRLVREGFLRVKDA
jgi:JmjC domain